MTDTTAEDIEVLKQGFGVLATLFVMAASREGGITLHVVDDLAFPVLLDNANACYGFLPDPGTGDDFVAGMVGVIGQLFLSTITDTGDPALDVPAGLTAYRDARLHREQALELLNQYLLKRHELDSETPKS